MTVRTASSRWGQDFRLLSADVALDGLVDQQLGKVAPGRHQIEQVGAVVLLSQGVRFLRLAHLFLKLSICSMRRVFFPPLGWLDSQCATRAAWP